jgi:hypothetical protein
MKARSEKRAVFIIGFNGLKVRSRQFFKDDFKRREGGVRADLREGKRICSGMKNILGGKPE